ncbi:pectate lyase family protein [Uliginosibacterium aquaticum]|uniref:Pectate lyase domain-containing protein n=1 Tax=Uliginosibacterium aquaticum TaxID=2731212 RepID=A0ABX2IJX6_9RHOO|nr:hypothetical protein [Uliginosibacterium aquaticum]NSL56602.1 hypothetical protein [Uliginosibacterium aquaticum]
MGARSYLAASDPVNTANHVSTATPAPGTPTAYPSISSDPSGGEFTIERETAPLDGWHSYYRAGGTLGNHQQVRVTGGSSATANRIYTCGTKKCIFDALKEAKNEPKIIRVYGNIDMRIDDDGVFRDFTSWDDQKASSIVIPSNTTFIGINDASGNPARLISAQIEIGKEFASTVNSDLADYEYWIKTLGKSQESYPGWTRNVIVRNLWIQTNFDVQPEGSSDAYYDGMVVAMAQNVWIDHVTVTDGQYKDKDLSGTRHDGALDIVRGSDYITVSNSAFIEHGKTTLVGNADSRDWSDLNRLHVTFKANYYADVASRLPRVRFGQVHVFNNYIEGDRESSTATKFENGIGMAIKGDVLIESTLWEIQPTKESEACKKVVTDHGSSLAFRQNRSWIKSSKYLPAGADVSNMLTGCGYASTKNWTPPYAYQVESAPLNLACIVKNGAGAGKVGLNNTSTAGACNTAPVAGSGENHSSSATSSSAASSSEASSSASSATSSSTAASSSTASSSASGGSATTITYPWSDDFSLATTATLFTTGYAKFTNDAGTEVSMYAKTGGSPTVSGGVITLAGARFTIGALGTGTTTGPTGSPANYTPGGIFNIIGKTCTLTINASQAGTGSTFQVYVDNNTTSTGNSPHATSTLSSTGTTTTKNTSVVVSVAATSIVAGDNTFTWKLDNASYTGGSFLQIRTDSSSAVYINSISLSCL